jgi:Ser/Thr protein kinase RdoA (MazF antagonist)
MQPTAFASMTADQQVASLGDCVAAILVQYDVGAHRVESINHELNSTFAVTCDSGEKFALRINVNSPRTLANLNAEIHWVRSITEVLTPKPVANRGGGFVTSAWHEAAGCERLAVMYSWLDGAEPGDDPTPEQLVAAGAAMAGLHGSSRGLEFPAGADLPDFADFFWGDADVLLSGDSMLTEDERRLVATAKDRIEAMLDLHRARATVQPIHADIHPWNMMWHDDTLAIFDFDDSGIGLPLQDLATSIYYLDTDAQVASFLEGYQSVRPLPDYTETDMTLLLLHRRIVLFNSLVQSANPEHREIIPEYRAETMRRIAEALNRPAV